MEEITTIEDLEEGDVVQVTGNGLDITSTVSVISYSSFKNSKTAMLEPSDGLTITLSDNTGPPLQNEGIQSHVGSVTVKRVN